MKKILSILLGLFLVMPALHAQKNKLVLTLDSAKQYALEYNRELVKAGISIQEAQAQLWQTISQGLPQIDGKVDYSNYLGATGSFNMGGMEQTIDFPSTSNAQITLSQLIFSGSYWVGIELSKLAKSLTENSKVRSELQVKQDVSTAFYNILMAEEGKEILEKNLKNITDIEQKTRAMVKAGIAEETDADQLSVQVLMLETTLKSTARQIELAYNMLRLQLGVGADIPVQVTGRLDNDAKNINLNAVLQDMMVLDNNIDYQLMKGQESIAQKQITLEKWSYAPTVAGFYNYTYKILKPNMDLSPKHVVGLTASIPIFSSGYRKNKVTAAKLNLQSIQTDVANVTDQLAIQEKQLRFNMQNAYDQYVAQEKNVTISKKVFNSMKLKYEQGLLSSLDLTTANSNYLQAENSYLTAMFNLIQAQIGLNKLLGTL